MLASYHGNQSAMSVTYPASDQHPSIVALDVDAAEVEAGHLVVTVTYVSPVPLNQPAAGIIVQSLTGQPLFGANMRTHPPARFQPDTTTGSCTLRIDNLPFHSSGYCLSAWFGDRDQDFDSKLQALTFEFVSKHHYARRPPLHVIGPLDLPCTWTHHSL